MKTAELTKAVLLNALVHGRKQAQHSLLLSIKSMEEALDWDTSYKSFVLCLNSNTTAPIVKVVSGFEYASDAKDCKNDMQHGWQSITYTTASRAQLGDILGACADIMLLIGTE